MRTSSSLSATAAARPHTNYLTFTRLFICSLFLLVTACSSPAFPKPPKGPDPLENPKRDNLIVGAYTYGGVWQGMEPIYALEADLGQRLGVVHWFTNWDTAWDANLVASAAQGGRLPMISWEPTNQAVEDIANGLYDAYISTWAKGAKNHNGTIYLRPFPEMNGNWAPWNGNPAGLVKAWQRTVDIFREAGAHKVKWVWSPNFTDQPGSAENRMELYYPGTHYVDILALDGYNWGTSRPWSNWTPFNAVFAEPYDRIVKLGPQPFWIAEIGSAEEGGNKGQWIKDMFHSTAFPRLEAIIWFNEKKTTDWRIQSSTASLEAFRQGLSDGTAIASAQ